MGRSITFLILVFSLMLTSGAFTYAQEDEETRTREFFLVTRPVKATGAARVSTTPKGKTTDQPTGKPGGGKTHKQPVPSVIDKSASIGLGYTLYKKSGQSAVRVEPSYEFSAGDAIKLIIEPNIDGYLYVFHTENDGEPTMLFPDARLLDGHNSVRAHVPYEVPANSETEDSWFTFDKKAATERLYIVITRNPIKDVPIEAALLNYCKSNPCPLRPTLSVWSEVKSLANAPALVSKTKTTGEKLSLGEKDSLTRGLSLTKSSPQPTVVRMSREINAESLVTLIDLVHK